MGRILLILSFILSLILYPIGWIYSFIKLSINNSIKNWYNSFDNLLKQTAIAIDVTGNVFLQHLFNDLLIKPRGYKFGKQSQTISFVLGVNKKMNTLTNLGIFIGKCLNKIDPNHLEKSIIEK